VGGCVGVGVCVCGWVWVWVGVGVGVAQRWQATQARIEPFVSPIFSMIVWATSSSSRAFRI
jgi:hypothetical protein